MADILGTLRRFADSAARNTHLAAAAAVATITRNYEMMIQTIDTKISDTTLEIDRLEAQRRLLAFDAAEAGDGTSKKLDTANGNLEKQRGKLSDLQAARAEAVARQEVKEREAAALSESERKTRALAAHRDMIAAVVKAEKAIDDAALALEAAREAKNAFMVAWPPMYANDIVSSAWGALKACISFKLKHFGYAWPMFMTADQSHWAAYFPSAERLGLIDPAADKD